MSLNNKTKQLATDTILFGISTFGSKILVFLLTPLYTAVLLTQEYGIADLINSSVNLIYPVLTLAISEATLRYSFDKDCFKNSVLNNSLIITIVSVAVLIAFYPVILSINSEITAQLSKFWWYFVAIYAMYNIHLCFSNFIKGIGKTKLFAIQGIAQTLTVVLCNIFFLLIVRNGLTGYLLSIIIGHAIPIVLMFISGKIWKYILPFKIDKNLLSDMLRYSIPMIPTLLAWAINLYINKYMLIGLLPNGEGLSASGIFSVANKIPSLLTAVISIFLQAWQLSAISNVNDKDESSYYTKTYNLMHMVCLIGCMLIIPFSKTISKLLFDPSYYLAWIHMPFLTISAFFSCLSGFLASAFRAYKKTKDLFVSVVIGAVINIVSTLILISIFGVLGVSIATMLSFFSTWLVRIITIQNLVAVKINITRTVLTYFLVVLSCLLISFDISGAYIFYLLFTVLVILLNLSDFKNILCETYLIIKKILKSNRRK